MANYIPEKGQIKEKSSTVPGKRKLVFLDQV